MTKHTLICLAALLGLAACKRETPLEERIAASGYPDEIGRIMLQTCATEGCHAGATPASALDLSTWASAFGGSDFGAVVIPYQPDWSHLFLHVNTFDDLGPQATPTMPEDEAGYLTRTEVQAVRDWIAAGARDRDGRAWWQAQETRSTGKVFALCAGSDLIGVADLGSNLVMRFVEVGQYPGTLEAPHFIAPSPDGQYVYVSLISGNLLEKYRADTYERVGRLALGASPALIALDATGTRAVVSHWNDLENETKLSLIDTEQMRLIDEVVAGPGFMSLPHGLQATADFRTLYVVANGGNYYVKVEIDADGFIDAEYYPLDPAGDPQPRNTPAYKPYHLILSEATGQVFISCSEKNEVRIFDLATDSLRAVIPTGRYPRLMAYDATAARLYVACRDEENFAVQGSRQGCVSVIDAATQTWLQHIYGLGQRPHGIGLAAAQRRLYVSSENTGGIDPPHHPIGGTSGPPGKYHVIDLDALRVIGEAETELAVFPNALLIIP
ncbi:MAG: hypothetical protein OHK0039_48090 [Bacteroidia bacterium]